MSQARGRARAGTPRWSLSTAFEEKARGQMWLEPASELGEDPGDAVPPAARGWQVMGPTGPL